MSGLAKAFVVINLVLTLFFLGAVATLHQTNKHWKDAAETGATKLVELRDLAQAKAEHDAGRIQALEENTGRQRVEIADLSTQNQSLQNENGSLSTDKQGLTQRVTVLESSIAQKDSHIQDKDAELARKDEEIARLVEEKKAADEAKTEAVQIAQRARLDLQNQIEATEAANKELADARRDLDDKTLFLQQLEKIGFPMDLTVQIAPKINGVVVAVQDGIVILSVGRDDQVKEGFEFTIYEKDRFVGKVKVESLLDDMSGARILFTENGQTIKAGQNATTRLAG